MTTVTERVKGTESVLEKNLLMKQGFLNLIQGCEMWKKNVLIRRIFCTMHSF